VIWRLWSQCEFGADSPSLHVMDNAMETGMIFGDAVREAVLPLVPALLAQCFGSPLLKALAIRRSSFLLS
jgi:hypothetical protein